MQAAARAGGSKANIGSAHLADTKLLFEQLMFDLAKGPMTDTEFVRDVVRPHFGMLVLSSPFMLHL